MEEAHLGRDKCLVYAHRCKRDTPVCYRVEGSRQTLRVSVLLDSCHFSELPSRLQNGGSLKLHAVLFCRGLERPEGMSPQDCVATEEFQQRTNAVSLEKVKAYSRRLSSDCAPKSSAQTVPLNPQLRLSDCAPKPSAQTVPLNPQLRLSDCTPKPSAQTVPLIPQLLRPLNALDDLCRLMQSYVNVRPGLSSSPAGHPSGVSVLPVSFELCNRLGACHISLCATGMQRCTLNVTLEQAAILARNHRLLPRCTMQAMDIMRKQGTRVEISAKNLKVMDEMPPSAPRLDTAQCTQCEDEPSYRGGPPQDREGAHRKLQRGPIVRQRGAQQTGLSSGQRGAQQTERGLSRQRGAYRKTERGPADREGPVVRQRGAQQTERGLSEGPSRQRGAYRKTERGPADRAELRVRQRGAQQTERGLSEGPSRQRGAYRKTERGPADRAELRSSLQTVHLSLYEAPCSSTAHKQTRNGQESVRGVGSFASSARESKTCCCLGREGNPIMPVIWSYQHHGGL
ncbi:hypothetical protein JZ751_019900 [Albula glossodonta]|uniref:Uncharacterized protein n=1 Tax=Albula glossodonta TaxID=121402 RepID=A0A8T2MUE6_9TELE|nr:hypothetical protein JZ751_019900 [Albula glossodonta]